MIWSCRILTFHNASGARDGPPRPRPENGERFVPGFKRRRVVISRLRLLYQLQSSFEVFSKAGWNGIIDVTAEAASLEKR
jgi:hypothetical protein